MKKFRFLLALAMVVSLISTVAFAADQSMDGYGIAAPATVAYTEGAPVTFDFTMIKGLTAEYGQITFSYDTDVWTIAVDTALSTSENIPGSIDVYAPTGGTYTDGQVMATVTATLKAGATAVGSEFVITQVDFYGDEDYIYCEGGYKTITVEAAAPAHKDAEVAVAEALKEFTGASGQVYTNVWVGTYTVTFNDDAVTGIKLAFNGKEETVAVEGAGTAVVDVAIVGKAGDVNVSVVK